MKGEFWQWVCGMRAAFQAATSVIVVASFPWRGGVVGDAGVAVWLTGPATWPQGATTALSLLFHMLSISSTGIVTSLKLAWLVVQCLAQVLKRGERFWYIPRGKKQLET